MAVSVFDDFADLDARVRGLLEGWRGDVEGEPLAPCLDVRAMRRSWLDRRDAVRALNRAASAPDLACVSRLRGDGIATRQAGEGSADPGDEQHDHAHDVLVADDVLSVA